MLSTVWLEIRIGGPNFVSKKMKVGGYSIGNDNVGCWDVIIKNTPPLVLTVWNHSDACGANSRVTLTSYKLSHSGVRSVD